MVGNEEVLVEWLRTLTDEQKDLVLEMYAEEYEEER